MPDSKKGVLSGRHKNILRALNDLGGSAEIPDISGFTGFSQGGLKRTFYGHGPIQSYVRRVEGENGKLIVELRSFDWEKGRSF